MGDRDAPREVAGCAIDRPHAVTSCPRARACAVRAAFVP